MRIHKVWSIAITAVVAMVFLMASALNSFACAWGGNIYQCNLLPKLIWIVILGLVLTVMFLIVKKQKKLTLLAFLPVIIIGLIGISLFVVSGDSISETKFGCSVADTSKERACWTNFAIEEHNFNYCDNIRSDIGLNSCYGKVAKYPSDVTWCEKIPKGHAGFMDCYRNIGKFTNQPSWCDNINRSTYHKYESQKISSINDCKKRVLANNSVSN